jgi:drug/metabolite transporter (DMT)-like permease
MQPPPHKPVISPLLGIAFGILAVSTASIFIRFAQQHAPSLVIAAYRLAIATLVLAPFALRRRNELRQLDRSGKWLAVLSGIFLAVHFATWITSLAYTSVASSVVLVTTTPLFVALFSPFTLKEPLSRLAGLGMLAALAGGVTVGLSDTCTLQGWQISCPPLAEFVRGKAFWGDLLALAGAVAAAGYVIIGRRLRLRLSLVSYVFAVYGTAAVVLVLLMFLSGQKPWGYPAETYLWFALLALIPQLIGHSTFNWALGYLSAAFVSITLLGEPIGSTILAYLVLDERPTILKMIGAILIFAGILIASQAERKNSAALSNKASTAP